MEKYVSIIIGAIGSVVAGLFGGWSASLTTLCIFMAIDYVTGIVVAGVFHSSPKTETGALESQTCIKGLFRKCYVLVLVLVAHRLDLEIGGCYLRDGVCIAFMASEAISIIENCGLMGMPVPETLKNAIDILKTKKEE